MVNSKRIFIISGTRAIQRVLGTARRDPDPRSPSCRCSERKASAQPSPCVSAAFRVLLPDHRVLLPDMHVGDEVDGLVGGFIGVEVDLVVFVPIPPVGAIESGSAASLNFLQDLKLIIGVHVVCAKCIACYSLPVGTGTIRGSIVRARLPW